MNRFYHLLFKGWDIGRIIRLLSGAFLLGYGIYASDYFFSVFGSVFVLMAVLNWSCCSSCGCGVSPGSKASYRDFVQTYDPNEYKKGGK